MTYAVATERQRRTEELRDELRSGVRAMREVQVRVGRTLLEIQRSHNLLLLGSTSFPIFCELEGLSPVEARELTEAFIREHARKPAGRRAAELEPKA